MAVPALKYLHDAGLLAAIAVPDLHESVHRPFQQLAMQSGISCTSLYKDTFKQALEELLLTIRPDAVFVIGFPWRIAVDSLPDCTHGWLNFHGGLLPEMRGSDPLFDCIRKGAPHTGIAVHRMDAGLDSGPIILQERIPLSPDATHGLLSTQLAFICERLCRELVRLISTGHMLIVVPQDESKAAYLPKPGPEDTCIRWESMTAIQVKALAQACNPQLGGAATQFGSWPFRIVDATIIDLTGDGTCFIPGTILFADPQHGLVIYCCDGKGVRVDVAATDEGYFPGYKMILFGLLPGQKLEDFV